ncbi:MAG TPA: class I SAM-dependent methyltransferase [Streptosporangiaceae bacterium]|nr:class I SAM-dependent methyltransferase [Streptosporangiaceae bacterium]
MSDALELNRRRWDALAARHGQGEDTYYDVPGFLAGGSSLSDRERAEVAVAAGEVAGLDLLHLQCHFGMDTLSWARLGARVTGVDFSPVAIRRARELADAAGLAAEFVQADVLALPASLAGRFDVVFASYGVLCWVGSARAWMESAAACLRPGGSLVLIDMHPLVGMVDTAQPLVADFPYGGEQPVTLESAASYAVGGLEARQTVQWPHGLGEIVTAAASAGLVVESLTEWFDEEQDRKLVVGADGRARFPLGSEYLPTSYGLRARRSLQG